MARILVVEDSPTETHQIVNTLARHGHQLLTASTGLQGLSLAVQQQPDLILMDVVMPGFKWFSGNSPDNQKYRNKPYTDYYCIQ